MSERKRILYAGDSPVGGPANYLLGILKYAGFETVHLSPDQKLTPSLLRQPFDGIIFSDYSCKQVSTSLQKSVLKQIEKGAGFLMVGGWGSFSGPFGGWKGSLIEKILPVQCLPRDDRKNFPSGALITVKQPHAILDLKALENPPAIMGINEVRPKKTGNILLTARKVLKVGSHLTLDPMEYPLLVIDKNPGKKIAAFTTDFAPHWCGGMVDWGKRTLKLPVTSKISIEVGSDYVGFAASLLKWLTGHRNF